MLNQPPTADELDLDAMEAECNAAPIGPWLNHTGDFISQEKSYMAICRVNTPVIMNHIKGRTESFHDGLNGLKDFIAHARTDMPRLIAEVRELREKLNRISRTSINYYKPTDDESYIPLMMAAVEMNIRLEGISKLAREALGEK